MKHAIKQAGLEHVYGVERITCAVQFVTQSSRHLHANGIGMRMCHMTRDVRSDLLGHLIVSVAPRSGSEQETLPRLIFLVYCPICNIHTLRIYDP